MPLLICLLIAFVSQCYGVSEEYYDDAATKEIAQLDNISNFRRAEVVVKENESHLKNDKITSDIMNYADYPNISDDDGFKVFVLNQGKKIKEKLRLNQPLQKELMTSSTTKKHLTKNASEIYCNNLTKHGPLNFFEDYQYIYDESTASQPQTEITSTTKIVDELKNNDSNRYLKDFFNLVPAVKKPNRNQHVIPNNKIWYVPARYPCWHLPVLFGELGTRKKTSDIFLAFHGRLKNVVALNAKNYPESKSYDIPAAVTHNNKWCEVEPCYGDHTLCLFSDSSVSKICDDNYRVHKPTTLQQIALVNTVNAMRNRIARGSSEEYPQLPTASNMKQMLYDYDLEKMAATWLSQCFPGPPPCSALDGRYVTHLECTKQALQCCVKSYKLDATSKCVPKEECFVPAIIGCIYTWFLSATKKLQRKDIECGHIESSTYNTAQLIWANTNKIGCAFSNRRNGDIRVACNFAPGAPFSLHTKYYCGFISHKDITQDVIHNHVHEGLNFSNLTLLSSLGLHLRPMENLNVRNYSTHVAKKLSSKVAKNFGKSWDLDSLNKIYTNSQLRRVFKDYRNGTRGVIARLVTRYTFHEESESRCDTDEPMYAIGQPGSLCVQKSRRFHALCYDFRDPSPGYRLVAVVAPAALFSLILYDLFSSVVRQTNY